MYQKTFGGQSPGGCVFDRLTLFVRSAELTGGQSDRRIRIMTVQTFRNLLSERPFKPFRLVMSSGKAYEVRHPEMAMLTRTDMLVGIDIEDDGVPAEFKICSLVHVIAVEPLSLAAAGPKQPETS
jgi:hypothetical protein